MTRTATPQCMSPTQWEHFFKPEVRSGGQALVAQGKVSPSKPSDTEVFAYVRPSFRVTLKSRSVESPVLVASCNCPPSKKGQFCKHIWAVLVGSAEKFPDFFDSKTELEKNAAEASRFGIDSGSGARVESPSQAAYKLKQADYRKEQYQKQKARLKAAKQPAVKNVFAAPQFPPQVELALKFFSENGFELRENLNKENVGLAKKKLSRVFHPDVGGSHDEILALNHYTEILLKFS